MKGLYKPFFILLAVTLPQGLMLGILGRVFWFLLSELSQRQITYWTIFGTAVAMMCAGLTLYVGACYIYKKEVHIYAAYLMFGFYFFFLVGSVLLYGKMIPGSIPSYMLMGVSPVITLLTLTMPAIAYGVMLIVEHTVERYQINAVSKPFLFMVAIPVFWYFFIHLIGVIHTIGFGNIPGEKIFEGILLILFTVSAAAFLFLFVMIAYIVLKRKQQLWHRRIGVIVCVGSFMGLVVNHSCGNVFGDFSYWGFYLCNLAVTGILLLPKAAKPKLRMLVFCIKSCLMIYSLYFFIVFLPYAPLALPGMVVFGLGVLLLMPTLLLFLHIQSLWMDFMYLITFYKIQHLVILFSLQLLVIPVIFGLVVRQDQVNLAQALEYTYQRSYTEEAKTNISTQAVARALNTIKRMGTNNRRENFLFTVTTSTPYLTSLYHYYVLDNLSISQDKVKQLQSIFLGEYEETTVAADSERGADVRVDRVESTTVFDREEQVYRSWIHFKLENTEDRLSEFYTLFSIPEGSYISDYYLYVEGEKKHGLIADKRAANWIYEQNRRRNRDPGVLTYLTGRDIEFKVFPFQGKEVRETGIEIIHRSPIDLSIGKAEISLRLTEPTANKAKEINLESYPQLAYIKKEAKEDLPKATREPKYYFILDYSKGNQKHKAAYNKRIESFIKAQGIENYVSEMIGVNFEENRVIYQEGWKDKLQSIQVKGGFYPSYTLKRIMYDHYANHLEQQPIFILLTSTTEKTIPMENLTDLEFANPEGLRYYQLTQGQGLIEHSLEGMSLQGAGKTVSGITEVPVRVWQDSKGRNFYLPDDDEDNIVLIESEFTPAENELSLSAWENGVLLKGLHRSYLLHPEQYFEQSLAIVKGSIVSRVMSPLTSFIVLESEGQEKAMLEKQRQILNSQKPLDLDMEDMTQMNEPSLLMMMSLVATGVLMGRKRKSKLADQTK